SGRRDAARRPRRAAVDRANAQGCTRRDCGDRKVGRRQRRHARRPDPGGRRRRARLAARGLSREAGGRGRGAGAPRGRSDEVGRRPEVGDVTDRPRLIALDSVAPAPAGLQAAADVLRAGGAVAFPTETFYGLAAAALDPASVKRIFALKGRPDSKPLLVLVDSVAMAETVPHVSEPARALMKRYWPGALTIVLPARAIVPSDVTAGTGTLGVRVSSHPIAHGLVRTLGEPLTAPSANPSGLEPPTTAD